MCRADQSKPDAARNWLIVSSSAARSEALAAARSMRSCPWCARCCSSRSAAKPERVRPASRAPARRLDPETARHLRTARHIGPCRQSAQGSDDRRGCRRRYMTRRPYCLARGPRSNDGCVETDLVDGVGHLSFFCAGNRPGAGLLLFRVSQSPFCWRSRRASLWPQFPGLP